MDPKHFLGGILDPIEGHIDPSGVTLAYAKSAQLGGAEIVRQTRVVDMRQRTDGSWDVITTQGSVHAEHVVNAGGLWAREVGRMVGLELPVLAMEHQYLITDDLPEFAGQPELLHCIDFEGEIYLRQERGGVLLGTYERAGVPWSPKVTPWDFGQDLLPNDLERIAPSLEVAFQHFPRLGELGIRKVVNGPFTFAPDGNPLVGPIAGLAQLLGGLRRHGRLQPGRRRRPVAGELDGRGRSGRRYLGHGCGPLRRLGHAQLHQRQGAGELFTPLPDSLSQRGTGSGAAAAHLSHIRATAGRECRVWRILRAGTCLVVCAQGERGPRAGDLPPFERARARGSRMPGGTRERRDDRNHQLRQVRNHRTRAP